MLTKVKTSYIDCGHRHSPFIAVRRFTESRPLPKCVRASNGEGIIEMSGFGNVDSLIVALQGGRITNVGAFGGIPNFLYNIMD